MRRRGAIAGITASPTMVGALTVMVVILAVFLAYNANNGLPFVPSYRLSVEVPDADLLVPGNEVRIGGVRVGVVEAIEPQQDEDGNVSARLDLKLDKDVDPLPKNSTFVVRARSALGLKYLEIVKGDSDEGYQAGRDDPDLARAPRAGRDRPGAEHLRRADPDRRSSANLFEFGNALAGRGPALNEALGKLPERARVPAAGDGEPRRPPTPTSRGSFRRSRRPPPRSPRSPRPRRSCSSRSTPPSPRSQQVARPVHPGDDLRDAADPRRGRPQALPVMRPFLAHSATLFTELQPGVKTLAETAAGARLGDRDGDPGAARHAGAQPPARRRPRSPCSASTTTTASAPASRRLDQTVDILGPTVRFVTPAQTVCNYGTLLFRNFASALAQGSNGGRWQRITVFEPPDGPEQRGQLRRRRPRTAAQQRPRQLPPLQPVPEHRRAGSDVRVRGRQRALRGRPAGDRQPARQPGDDDRRPARVRRASRRAASERNRAPRPPSATRPSRRRTRGSGAAPTAAPRRGSSAC